MTLDKKIDIIEICNEIEGKLEFLEKEANLILSMIKDTNRTLKHCVGLAKCTPQEPCDMCVESDKREKEM
uniref:Transcriptional regulator n=1 Tax=viral metagenome TaxID=1070528 RepID=A0A6M3LP69_9ZZZZ